MIYTTGSNLPVTGAYAMNGANELVFAAVYIGTRLIWEAIRSCYGNGYWVNTKPWVNTDGWNNG